MKKAILILLALMIELHAQSQAVIDRANTIFSNAFVRVTTAQTNYFAINGKYRQCRRSHNAIPSDGTDLAPDGFISDYTNFTSITNMPFAIQIDQYVAPEGPGWSLTAIVYYGTNLWIKCQQTGPETFRNRDWSKTNFVK